MTRTLVLNAVCAATICGLWSPCSTATSQALGMEQTTHQKLPYALRHRNVLRHAHLIGLVTRVSIINLCEVKFNDTVLLKLGSG